MSWPNDDDGNVFRSLKESGFDFTKKYKIDINLDFDNWPLSNNTIAEIEALYPSIRIIEPEAGEDIGNGKDIGFLQFQVHSKLEYTYIIELQANITTKISRYGGKCNSWGVGQW